MSWYFIRLTTDLITKEALAYWLGEPYLISKEYSRRMKLHYHILWRSNFDKNQIKDMFYTKFPDEPRGVRTLKVDLVANTDEDLDQAATYTVKDDDYIYSDFFDDRIDQYVQNAFTKETPTQKIHRIIEEELENDRPNFVQLSKQIIQIKADAGLEIYSSKIEALVLSAMCRHDANVTERVVKKFKIFSFDPI